MLTVDSCMQQRLTVGMRLGRPGASSVPGIAHTLQAQGGLLARFCFMASAYICCAMTAFVTMKEPTQT